MTGGGGGIGTAATIAACGFAVKDASEINRDDDISDAAIILNVGTTVGLPLLLGSGKLLGKVSGLGKAGNLTKAVLKKVPGSGTAARAIRGTSNLADEAIAKNPLLAKAFRGNRALGYRNLDGSLGFQFTKQARDATRLAQTNRLAQKGLLPTTNIGRLGITAVEDSTGVFKINIPDEGITVVDDAGNLIKIPNTVDDGAATLVDDIGDINGKYELKYSEGGEEKIITIDPTKLSEEAATDLARAVGREVPTNTTNSTGVRTTGEATSTEAGEAVANPATAANAVDNAEAGATVTVTRPQNSPQVSELLEEFKNVDNNPFNTANPEVRILEAADDGTIKFQVNDGEVRSLSRDEFITFNEQAVKAKNLAVQTKGTEDLVSRMVEIGPEDIRNYKIQPQIIDNQADLVEVTLTGNGTTETYLLTKKSYESLKRQVPSSLIDEGGVRVIDQATSTIYTQPPVDVEALSQQASNSADGVVIKKIDDTGEVTLEISREDGSTTNQVFNKEQFLEFQSRYNGDISIANEVNQVELGAIKIKSSSRNTVSVNTPATNKVKDIALEANNGTEFKITTSQGDPNSFEVVYTTPIETKSAVLNKEEVVQLQNILEYQKDARLVFDETAGVIPKSNIKIPQELKRPNVVIDNTINNTTPSTVPPGATPTPQAAAAIQSVDEAASVNPEMTVGKYDSSTNTYEVSFGDKVVETDPKGLNQLIEDAQNRGIPISKNSLDNIEIDNIIAGANKDSSLVLKGVEVETGTHVISYNGQEFNLTEDAYKSLKNSLRRKNIEISEEAAQAIVSPSVPPSAEPILPNSSLGQTTKELSKAVRNKIIGFNEINNEVIIQSVTENGQVAIYKMSLKDYNRVNNGINNSGGTPITGLELISKANENSTKGLVTRKIINENADVSVISETERGVVLKIQTTSNGVTNNAYNFVEDQAFDDINVILELNGKQAIPKAPVNSSLKTTPDSIAENMTASIDSNSQIEIIEGVGKDNDSFFQITNGNTSESAVLNQSQVNKVLTTAEEKGTIVKKVYKNKKVEVEIGKDEQVLNDLLNKLEDNSRVELIPNKISDEFIVKLYPNSDAATSPEYFSLTKAQYDQLQNTMETGKSSIIPSNASISNIANGDNTEIIITHTNPQGRTFTTALRKEQVSEFIDNTTVELPTNFNGIPTVSTTPATPTPTPATPTTPTIKPVEEIPKIIEPPVAPTSLPPSVPPETISSASTPTTSFNTNNKPTDIRKTVSPSKTPKDTVEEIYKAEPEFANVTEQVDNLDADIPRTATKSTAERAIKKTEVFPSVSIELEPSARLFNKISEIESASVPHTVEWIQNNVVLVASDVKDIFMASQLDEFVTFTANNSKSYKVRVDNILNIRFSNNTYWSYPNPNL